MAENKSKTSNKEFEELTGISNSDLLVKIKEGTKNPKQKVLSGFKVTPLKVDCCNRRLRKGRRGRIEENQWSSEEEQKLLEIHNYVGNRWAFLAKQLPGRSDNNIKNHFFSRIRMALRHLLSQVKGKIIPKKKIQNSTVYRLVSLSDEAFNLSTSWSHQLISTAQDLKNRLLNYFYSQSISDHSAIKLTEDLYDFSCLFHKRKVIQKDFNQRSNDSQEEQCLVDELIPEEKDEVKQQLEEENKEKKPHKSLFDENNDNNSEKNPLIFEWESFLSLNFHVSFQDSWEENYFSSSSFEEIRPFSLREATSLLPHLQKPI